MSGLTGLYYLNNSGHRWVVYQDGKKEKITLETKSGELVTRSVNYYEQLGNWATANISYKGKRINVFMDTLLED